MFYQENGAGCGPGYEEERNAQRKRLWGKSRQKTKELLTSIPGGIYSDDIRRRQLKEIDLLIDHYSKLLNAEGRDYASLVYQRLSIRNGVQFIF